MTNGYREYRPIDETSEPTALAKALALIAGAVVIVGVGAAGVTSIATPLPARPAMVRTVAVPAADPGNR